MGKIEVKGTATRTVNYDLMKITVNFHARNDSTPKRVSKQVLDECETFLGKLKEKGFDLSKIELMADEVHQTSDYSNNHKTYTYEANREICFICKYDMKLLNNIRSILNDIEATVDYDIIYLLSNENAIQDDLIKEALVDAKNKAEMLAEAIGQKVKGLISADKNNPNVPKYSDDPLSYLCMTLESGDSEDSYKNSNELAATNTTITEDIYTVWEIE